MGLLLLIFLLTTAMGAIFSRLAPRPFPTALSPTAMSVTPKEKERLMLLGTTAGAPGIMVDAIRSGNIMDPAHMERAAQMKAEWETGAALLAPYFERQKRINREREELRALGEKMGGSPVGMKYAAIRERLGAQPLPQSDWFLRIQTAEHGFVDLGLSAHDDVIDDCIFDATRSVPRFQAFLHSPESSVLIFEHEGS